MVTTIWNKMHAYDWYSHFCPSPTGPKKVSFQYLEKSGEISNIIKVMGKKLQFLSVLIIAYLDIAHQQLRHSLDRRPLLVK